MDTTNFRARLLRRERLVGTLLTIPAPALAEMCADAGFDWLFVDMEHGAFDLDAVERVAQAVGERCACVVRVPANDRVWIGKVLDLGVSGIIVPLVNSAPEAAHAVRAAKYPPQGGRGVGLGRAARYGAHLNEYLAGANDETAVIVQIEHVDAVRNLESIVETPDVDALMIGPFDLSGSFGKPGRIGDADVQAAIAHVRDTALRREIPVSIFCPTVEQAQQAQSEGYTLILVGADNLLFGHALRALLNDLGKE
ncbi:MAG: 2,4-dihydroxyhept-2-ene-1,7-dioic acid aldolase [Chloroflexi bacterium]|nr:2,4-dihydroxyhept-2-ene-1,7-dioic acid aldolase [Chloroflexota bacterium]